MEFFRIRRDIPFMRHALVFNIISALTFVAAVFFLATRGLHFSIEFTGGTVIEVAYAQSADVPKVRTTVEALGLGDVQVQNFGSSRDVMIRLPVRADLKQGDLDDPRVRRAVQGRGRHASAAKDAAVEQGQAASRQVCAARRRGAGAPVAQRVGRPAGRQGTGRRTAPRRWPSSSSAS